MRLPVLKINIRNYIFYFNIVPIMQHIEYNSVFFVSMGFSIIDNKAPNEKNKWIK